MMVSVQGPGVSRASIPVLLVLAILGFPILAHADWGKPLGPTYAGPEVLPRPVSPAPSALSTEERATIHVFEKAARSVVFVANTSIQRDFWSLNVYEVPQGAGSGFIWNHEGHIVTNFHVIYGADAVTVVLADGSDYPARIVGMDPDQDLAVLQIQPPKEKLIPIVLGRSRDLRVGQKVLAIGNPFGLDQTLTTGIVSALGRTIRSMTDRTIDGVIQTDAAINPGNSGGPLLDGFGRLVGVNTQIMSPSGAYAGIGFAVPVDTVNRIVPELIKFGRIIRPTLGVTPVPDEIAERLGVKGVIVGRVAAGGPAAHAGLRGTRETLGGRLGLGDRLRLGDIITKLDGKSVETVDDFYRLLENHRIGDQVVIEYVRDSHSREATLILVSD